MVRLREARYSIVIVKSTGDCSKQMAGYSILENRTAKGFDDPVPSETIPISDFKTDEMIDLRIDSRTRVESSRVFAHLFLYIRNFDSLEKDIGTFTFYNFHGSNFIHLSDI